VLKRILLAEFEPISTRCADLPEDVSALVMNMLNGDREKRTRDLADVRAVLERYAATTVTLSEPAVNATEAAATSAPESNARLDTNQAVSLAPSSPMRRRSRLILFAAAFVATATGIAVIGMNQAPRPNLSTASPALPIESNAPAASAATSTSSAPLPDPHPETTQTASLVAPSNGTSMAKPPPRAATSSPRVVVPSLGTPQPRTGIASATPSFVPAASASAAPAPKLPANIAKGPKD
jgi:hypothetical protein